MTATAINEFNRTTFVHVENGGTFTKNQLGWFGVQKTVWPRVENNPVRRVPTLSEELRAWETAGTEIWDLIDGLED